MRKIALKRLLIFLKRLMISEKLMFNILNDVYSAVEAMYIRMTYPMINQKYISLDV